MTYTKESITALLTTDEPATLTMANGDELELTPCREFGQLAYILVASPSLPWLGGNASEVADQLNKYETLVAENEADKLRLANLREKLLNPGPDMTGDEWEDTFSFYSDWHKDIYGYRPRDISRRTKPRDEF